MGKWGGYHTDFRHLARGFAGNERALADEVGEALLAAGLLAEKPSVGQRHVFLNPRRAADIHGLIERGDRAVRPAPSVDGADTHARSWPRRRSPCARSLGAGVYRPERPDRVARTLAALHRWGPTPAAATPCRPSATRPRSRSSTSTGR